jgi:hypothetical protein
MSQRGGIRGRGRGSGPGRGGGRGGSRSNGGDGSGGSPRDESGRPPHGGGGLGGGRGRGGPPAIHAAGASPRIDPRLASVPAAEATDLAAEPYNPRHPLRPGYGTLGTEVILRANFFPITIPKRPILEYTVSIEPAAGSRKLKTRLFQLLEQNVAFQPHINYTAHDHSARLVASQRLPQPLDVRITFIGEGMTVALPNAREYTVSIVANGKLETSELQKYVFPGLRVRVFRVRANSIHRYVSADPTARDYNPLPVISALNLVLRQHASRGGFRLGRNQYFFTPNEHLQLSRGLARLLSLCPARLQAAHGERERVHVRVLRTRQPRERPASVSACARKATHALHQEAHCSHAPPWARRGCAENRADTSGRALAQRRWTRRDDHPRTVLYAEFVLFRSRSARSLTGTQSIRTYHFSTRTPCPSSTSGWRGRSSCLRSSATL